MRYAYFPGCKIPHHLPRYGKTVQTVCAALKIELVPIEFACCGWPMRHENAVASAFTAMRNIALAEQQGLNIVTPCKCCFGNFKHALSRMQADARLAAEVGNLLGREGLTMPQQTKVRHLLTVLDRDIGATRIAELVTAPLADARVACHYGCHALRPGNVTEFDDPLAPTVFERLISATGATTVDWDLRLECCGHPIRGRDNTISDALMRNKLRSAEKAQATVIATGCTYCQMQFEQERAALPDCDALASAPQAMLFTELIARALGLSVAS